MKLLVSENLPAITIAHQKEFAFTGKQNMITHSIFNSNQPYKIGPPPSKERLNECFGLVWWANALHNSFPEFSANALQKLKKQRYDKIFCSLHLIASLAMLGNTSW